MVRVVRGKKPIAYSSVKTAKEMAFSNSQTELMNEIENQEPDYASKNGHIKKMLEFMDNHYDSMKT